MRILIFHNYLDTIGGGEKLVLTLAREIGADIITTNLDGDIVRQMGFTCDNILSLGNTLTIPPLKQVHTSLKFLLCDFRGKYDFFIFSGEWSVFAARRHKPNLLYCHTPPRHFYDLYDVFLSRLGFFRRLLFRLWVWVHKPITEHFIGHIDRLVSNSKNTRERVKKYYRRDSDVIYPFADCSRYHYVKTGDYWLSVNRFYPEKRIKLQTEVFRRLPEKKLIIVGGFARGDHADAYRKGVIEDLPENVFLLGRVSEDRLRQLYGECEAFITTSLDEDFGMTPLEAMASGKPVVAVKEGGYLETVVDGVTGRLVDADINSLLRAVREVSTNPLKYRVACEQQAARFDLALFVEKMRSAIGIAGAASTSREEPDDILS